VGVRRLTSVERPGREPSEAVALDLLLPSGRLRAHRFGPARGRLTVGIPGISANSRSFDYLGERLGGGRRQLVALDLRGRGHSSMSPPGTYGWRRHALDVLAASAQLGRPPFDVIGHSMGAFVAMEMAGLDPSDIRRVVLLDGLGLPDMLAVTAILRVVRRLSGPSPTADEYLERVRLTGAVTPWNGYWDRAFRYELTADAGGVRPRTDAGKLKDYGIGSYIRELLDAIGRRPESEQYRFLVYVGTADRDRFLGAVRGAQVVEVDANHYGVMTHPATASAIRAFLSP